MRFSSLFALGALPVSSGARYLLKENIIGAAFYDHFDWEAVDDPSHGRVQVSSSCNRNKH